MVVMRWLQPYLPDLIFGLICALLLWLTRPAYLAFTRRRSGFGTVFNSHTGAPEALATVTLKDLHGQSVRSAVTDKQGRYRIVAPKGDYIVDVKKFGYVYPSKLLGKSAATTLYDDLLTARHIIVNDVGAITKNIAIDPPVTKGHARVAAKSFVLPKVVQETLSLLGPAGALAYAYVQDRALPWSILVVYLGVMVSRLASFKPPRPPFGTIRDAVNKGPVQGAAVRIIDTKFNKLLETQMTSPKGRYAFVVKPGSYRILITKPGYHGVMMNFPRIQQDAYLLAKDVMLKRATKKKTAAPAVTELEAHLPPAAYQEA